MKWISAKERLPEFDKDVLVLTDEETIYLSSLSESKHGGLTWDVGCCCNEWRHGDAIGWIYLEDLIKLDIDSAVEIINNSKWI